MLPAAAAAVRINNGSTDGWKQLVMDRVGCWYGVGRVWGGMGSQWGQWGSRVGDRDWMGEGEEGEALVQRCCIHCSRCVRDAIGGKGQCSYHSARSYGTNVKIDRRGFAGLRPLTEEVVEVSVNTGVEGVESILAVLRSGKELQCGPRGLAPDDGVIWRKDAIALSEPKEFGQLPLFGVGGRKWLCHNFLHHPAHNSAATLHAPIQKSEVGK
jgi:hypothetical protein